VDAGARWLGPLSDPLELIRAAGAGHRFPSGRTGLEPTDFAVHGGEIVALIGPNGSGKTTLLRLLAGDLEPATGRVVVNTAVRRGWAPDEAVHVDELSGRANALLHARAWGAPAAAVDALLAAFGLAADADVPAREYSFGMRRKLALVQALVHEPALLLLDEPAVGLDPSAVNVLIERMRGRAATAGSVVFGTNDLAVATVATRIAFLHRGRIVVDAPPSELMRAVAGHTRIEVLLDALPARAPVFPGHVSAVAIDIGYVIETQAGSADLPPICDAVVRSGARIRDIRVREPGLADAFLRFTGAALGPEPAPRGTAVEDAGPTADHARHAHEVSGAAGGRRRGPRWR
jgi:ABC-type multidrug transport system ATPase subunit